MKNHKIYIATTWQQSVSGAYVLKCEQALYDEVVVDLFGFNALQMGGDASNLLVQSRIASRYKAISAIHASSDKSAHNVCCEDDFLPFAEMSMDVLLLPHRLEFSPRPHQTLREAFRVLVPDGYVVITGFNPCSLWGLKMLIKRMCADPGYPWGAQWIRLTRLKDWLSVLDFEIVHCEMTAHMPPFENLVWHKRFYTLHRLMCKYMAMFGGVYFIVAKKRVVGMTPLKPTWQKSVLETVLAGHKNKNMKSYEPNEEVSNTHSND